MPDIIWVSMFLENLNRKTQASKTQQTPSDCATTTSGVYTDFIVQLDQPVHVPWLDPN